CLDCGLNFDVLLRCEIHRGDKVAGKRFTLMSLLPLLQYLDALFVFSKPRFSEVIPKIERLDAGRGTDHRAYRAVRRLSQKSDVLQTFFADFSANIRRHFLHIARLQKLVRVKHRERPLLGRDIRGSVISLACYETVQAFNELNRLFRAVANAQPYEHLSQTHSVQTHASLSLLL